MKKLGLSCLIVIIVFSNLFSQNTKTLTLASGEGWYRIIEGTYRGSGIVKLYGTSGNNKGTDITMNVSLMAYSQGGNINIINNLYYNQNHIKEIRGGSSNGKFVLDVYFEYINTPSNLTVKTDGNNLPILDDAFFDPVDDLTGKISISGKVIGMNSTRFPIYYSGKVGIGTTSPDQSLEVITPYSNNVDEEIRIGTNIPNIGFTGLGFNFYSTETGAFSRQITEYAGGNKYIPIKFSHGNTFFNGNVGIGTVSPEYKLDVIGTIRAQEIKVDLNGADFVFADDYELRSLEEVESFVKENKHLPDIAPASEMEIDGTELGDLNTKFLQKIEELTLYIIEQNKKTNELIEEVQVLKNENELLKEKITKLETTK